MMCNRSFLLFLLLFGHLLSLPAQQDYQVQRFTTDNGLPSNGIKGLQWDQATGFLWIATESGVLRYNGVDLLPFSKTSPDLPAERMIFMLKNREGRIYTVDEDGKIFFVIANKLQFLYNAELDTRASAFKLVGLAASGKLFRQSLDHPPPHYGFDFYYEQMIPLSETHMWLNHGDSLYDYILGMLHPSFITTLETGSRLFYLQGQLFGFNDRLGFYRLDPGNYRKIPTPIKFAGTLPDVAWKPKQALKEQGQLFWDCGMSNPILIKDSMAWVLDYKDQQLTSRLICSVVPTDAMISHVQYVESSGTLFLGMSSKGIVVIRKLLVRPVKKPTPAFDDNTSYYSQLLLPNGAVLTNRGDVLGGPRPPSALMPVLNSRYRDKPDLNNFLYTSRDSILWYSEDDSMYAYSYKLHKTFPIYDGKGSITDGFAESGGRVYVGNAMGIGVMQDWKLNYLYKYPKPDINSNVPYSMLELSPGILVMGTCNGLLRYDIQANRLDTVPGLSHFCVRALWKYRDYLFIGTYGHGIYLMKNGEIRPIPIDKHNYLRFAHCFMPDKLGYCWISTNNGLFRASPADMANAFENNVQQVYYLYYGKKDGMDITELNGGCTPCGLMINDSTLSFPSMDGLVWVDPSVSPDVPAGKIYIEEFIADNKYINTSSLLKPILPSNTRDLAFRLGYPAWANPDNLYVEYKLEPYLKEWKTLEVEHDPIIPFSNLPSGEYHLVVRKLNGFGEGNYSYDQFSFRIQAPWFQQAWAWLMGLFILLLMVIGAVNLRTQQIKVSQGKLKKQVAERTRELREKSKELEKTDHMKTRLVSIISHDLVTPLKFLHLAGKNLIEKKDELSEDLHQEAIIEIMNTSKELELLSVNILNWIKYKNEDRRLAKESFNLYQLTDQLFRVFNSLAKQKQIRLINQVDKELALYQFIEPVKIILYNLILNGINFTQEGYILVSSAVTPDGVYINVIDTGVGMTQDQINNVKGDPFIISSANVDNRKGNGLGYLIVKDLLKIIRGKISIRSEKGAGTQITIMLPVRHGKQKQA